MKQYTIALAVLAAALSGCSTMGPTTSELVNDGRNTDNVVTYGMGYHQQRYSPLNQINKTNVSRLKPVYNTLLGNDVGEQAQPMIYNGVIYIANAKQTVAIDALSGKKIWDVPTNYNADTPRVVCCGISNKGVALFEGKVFRTTLDAHVVAYDQKTGKEIWKQKAAEWTEGYSMTVAPQIANGVLVTGISGAEFTTRGFLDGWDPETGKKLWRRYTTAAPDERGGDTWPKNNDAYKRGGATTWITGSYDPELDLLYWGTGNASPWNPKNRPGDNLYVASVIAVKPKTGEIVWHYQFAPNEMHDQDAVSELINADLEVDGTKRKVIMQLNRNGFLYVIDRTNGKLLRANKYGSVTWATHVDLATGRPVESESTKKLRAGEWVEYLPGILGSKNWEHAAFNPNTGLLYANTLYDPRMYRLTDIPDPKVGARAGGYESKVITVPKGQPVGWIEAIDPLTGKPKWRVPQTELQIWSAILATGGGLLFNGKHTGEFFAIDAETGKTIWEFKTNSGINAQPVTWTHKGKQYVTILSGLGGLYGSNAARRATFFKDDKRESAIWTFALPD